MPCPSVERLGEVIQGLIPGPEADLLESHVEICSDCQRALEWLTAWPSSGSGPRSRPAPSMSPSTNPDGEFLCRLEEEPPHRLRPGASSAGQASGSDRRAKLDPEDDSPRVTVVRVSPQQVSTLQPLLRRRLLAATGILVAGAIVGIRGEPWSNLGEHHPLTVMLFAGTILMSAVFFVILWRKRFLSVPTLRSIEVAFFSGMVAYGSMALWEIASRDLPAWNTQLGHRGLIIASRAFVIPPCLLIVLYGLFIPNTWRRAVLMLGMLSLLAPVVVVFVTLTDPTFTLPLALEPLSEMSMWLVLTLGSPCSARLGWKRYANRPWRPAAWASTS